MDTRFIPVDTRFISFNIRWTPGSSRSTHGSSRSTHGSLRFLTVPYGSLRFIPVNTRFITVHYGALRFITGIVTIPVNTRFITVHYGSSRSTPGSSRSTRGLNFLPRFDAGSTELSNMSHFFKFVPGLSKVIQGSSWLVTGHPGSSLPTPGSSRFLPVGEPGVEPG